MGVPNEILTTTLVAQGDSVIFFPPKVSHLGWLGGHCGTGPYYRAIEFSQNCS